MTDRPTVLKPCPHCRGEAKGLSYHLDSSHRVGWQVFCNTTSCTLGIRGIDRAEVEATWNRRDDAAPISMILPCPRCHQLHVDAPEPEKGWTNPPHKSHLCHSCGLVWRPADVPTYGVATISTAGKHDTWRAP